MKITIKRYFERTRQIADFVPIKSACEATMEIELGDPENGLDQAREFSQTLDLFVQSEVEKTLMGYSPCCVVCGGKPIFPKKDLTKAGLCDTCNQKQLMEARQFKADKPTNRAA